MKNGRSLMELAQELERQRNAKRDYLLDTRNLEMGFVEAGAYQMMMRNDSKNVSTLLGVGEIAHRQIGSALGIPAKYYDKMRAENPELLAQNVNSWFTMTPQKRGRFFPNGIGESIMPKLQKLCFRFLPKCRMCGLKAVRLLKARCISRQ